MSASSSWVDLRISPDELRIEHVLNTDQTYAWEQTDRNVWTGVVGRNVISLKSTKNTTCAQAHSGSLNCLDEYFQKSESLKKLYKHWSSELARIHNIAKYVPGCRVLRQEPWEVLVTLLIPRCGGAADIGEIVSDLREAYGSPLFCIEDEVYYAFPTVAVLSKADEESLRDIGFGQRAKLVIKFSQAIEQRGGEAFLRKLRRQTIEKTREVLLSLPGVNLKMADTVALYALDKSSVIPVDMRMHRVLKRHFPAALPAQDGLSLLRKDFLSRKMYDNIVEAVREKLGEHCGWAITLLLAGETPAVQETLPADLQTEEMGFSSFIGVTESRYSSRRPGYVSWDNDLQCVMGLDYGKYQAKEALSLAAATPRYMSRHNTKDREKHLDVSAAVKATAVVVVPTPPGVSTPPDRSREKHLGDSTPLKANAAMLTPASRHFSRKQCASEDAQSMSDAVHHCGTNAAGPRSPPRSVASSVKEHAAVAASSLQACSGNKKHDNQPQTPASSSRASRPTKAQSKRSRSPVLDDTLMSNSSPPKVRRKDTPADISATPREMKKAKNPCPSSRRSPAPDGQREEITQKNEGGTSQVREEKDGEEKEIHERKILVDGTADDDEQKLNGKHIVWETKTLNGEKKGKNGKMDKGEKEDNHGEAEKNVQMDESKNYQKDDADDESKKEGEEKNEKSENEESAKQSIALRTFSDNSGKSKKSRSEESNDLDKNIKSTKGKSGRRNDSDSSDKNEKNKSEGSNNGSDSDSSSSSVPSAPQVIPLRLSQRNSNRLRACQIEAMQREKRETLMRQNHLEMKRITPVHRRGGHGVKSIRSNNNDLASAANEDQAGQGSVQMRAEHVKYAQLRRLMVPEDDAVRMGDSNARQPRVCGRTKAGDTRRTPVRPRGRRPQRDDTLMASATMPRPRRPAGPGNAQHSDSDSLTVRLSDEERGVMTSTDPRLRPWPWNLGDDEISVSPAGEGARNKAKLSPTPSGRRRAQGSRMDQESIEGAIVRALSCPEDADFDDDIDSEKDPTFRIGVSRKATTSGRRRGRPPKNTPRQHQRRQPRGSKSSDSYSERDDSPPSASRKQRSVRTTQNPIRSPSLSPSSTSPAAERAAATDVTRTLARGTADVATSSSPIHVPRQVMTKSPVPTSYAQWKRRRARAMWDRSLEDTEGKGEKWRKRQKTNSRKHDSDKEEEGDSKNDRTELKPLMARSREERMQKREFQRRLEEAKSASGAEFSSSVSTPPVQNTAISVPHQALSSSVQTPADDASCVSTYKGDESQYTKEGLRKPKDRLFIDPDRSGTGTQLHTPPRKQEGALKAQKRSDTITKAQYDSDDEPLQNAFIGRGKPQLVGEERLPPRRRLASVDDADSTLPQTKDMSDDYGRPDMRKRRSPDEYTKEGIRKPRKPEEVLKEGAWRPSNVLENPMRDGLTDSDILLARNSCETLKNGKPVRPMEGESRSTQAEEVRVDHVEAMSIPQNGLLNPSGTLPTPEPTQETANHSPPQEAPSSAATKSDSIHTTHTSEEACSMDVHATAPGVTQLADALNSPAGTFVEEEASVKDVFVPDNAQSVEFLR